MKTYYGVKFIEKEYDVIIEMESLLKESIPIMSDLSQEDFGIYSEDGNIMILKLNNKNLSKIPDSIGNLTNLEELHLSGNNLEIVPETLNNLESLNILDLNNNQLKTLPDSFIFLKALEILKLEGNALECLPRNFGSLADLEELYLSRNNLEKLPETIGKLERLYILSLERNKLSFLPDSFTDLEELEQLYLNENELEYLPKSFGNLESLEKLQLSRNKLKKLPKSLKALKWLEILHLSENNLCKIPKIFKKVNRIEDLKLDCNQLTILPNCIRYLGRLEKISLSNNKLKRLPNCCGEAESLEFINLVGNPLIELPDSLGSLRFIKKIYLPECLKKENIKNVSQEFLVDCDSIQIDPDEWAVLGDLIELIGEEIPRTMDSEDNLFSVYFENGHITNLVIPYKNLEFLPSSIKNLTVLKKLNLRGNNLKNLPQSIQNLKSLKNLDLSYNKFNDLPGNMWSLKNITKLDLKYNPWNVESKSIIRNSIPVILDHCRKKATITLFLSHAVIENKAYQIKELISYLENQPEIYTVHHCERDLVGNIDEFMDEYVPMSQILLFLATEKSICYSKDCRREVEIAKQNEIPIIPIIGSDVSWDDLQDLNINRESGIEFKKQSFEAFCEELYDKIMYYKQNINVFEKEERKVDRQILNFDHAFSKLIKSYNFKQVVRDNPIAIDYERFITKPQFEQADFFIQYLSKFKEPTINVS